MADRHLPGGPDRGAVLLPAPGMPGHGEFPEGLAARQALAARFRHHFPDDTGSSPAFLRAVCWGVGLAACWPCAPVLARGGQVSARNGIVRRYLALAGELA